MLENAVSLVNCHFFQWLMEVKLWRRYYWIWRWLYIWYFWSLEGDSKLVVPQLTLVKYRIHWFEPFSWLASRSVVDINSEKCRRDSTNNLIWTSVKAELITFWSDWRTCTWMNIDWLLRWMIGLGCKNLWVRIGTVICKLFNENSKSYPESEFGRETAKLFLDVVTQICIIGASAVTLKFGKPYRAIRFRQEV